MTESHNTPTMKMNPMPTRCKRQANATTDTELKQAGTPVCAAFAHKEA